MPKQYLPLFMTRAKRELILSNVFLDFFAATIVLFVFESFYAKSKTKLYKITIYERKEKTEGIVNRFCCEP